MGAAKDRRRREHEDQRALAWMTAALTRAGDLPAFLQFVAPDSPAARTERAAAKVKAFDALARALGHGR